MTREKYQSLKIQIHRLLWDLKVALRRRRAAPPTGDSKYSLQPHQVYPAGNHLWNYVFDRVPSRPRTPIADQTTPICSMGSCFAEEIRTYLVGKQFNFLQLEESPFGSCKWGRVYTTMNIAQIFEYSLHGCFKPVKRIWRIANGFIDPYRDMARYGTLEEAEFEIASHEERSRQALKTCRLLIITPGQNELWVFKEDGLAWAHRPDSEILRVYGAARFEQKRLTCDENVVFLKRALSLLWSHNPTCEVILTLSPVPSWATFYDTGVVVRSLENKCILRDAISRVVEEYPDRLHYFPSFEYVLLYGQSALEIDNRHVKKKVVDQIMSGFERTFVKNANLESSPE